MKQPERNEHDTSLLHVDQALARILAMTTPVTDSETLPIRDALGRVLASTITSPINVPSYANSAMDGYALRTDDLPVAPQQTQLTVIGTSWAGTPFTGTLMPGQCVRIMTGSTSG